MGPLLRNPAALDEEDAVAEAGGGQPVGDVHGGAPLCHLIVFDNALVDRQHRRFDMLVHAIQILHAL